jgi:hypothetical protein
MIRKQAQPGVLMMKRFGAKFIPVFLISCFCFLAVTDVVADRDRDQQQAKLDAACEEARESKLAPMRKQFVEDCVKNKEQPSRQACEDFYADYGAQSGRRAPLFYDLPECVEAFDFQNSQRRR